MSIVSRLGKVLLHRNISRRLFSGSAHTSGPVNPVCPKLLRLDNLLGVPLIAVSRGGLSNMSPLLLPSKACEVKS